MGNESAIILPVPEAEAVVGALRRQYDRSARLGVPAHITLMYPFFPSEIVVREINTLKDFCASLEATEFSLTQVRRFPATAYLHPDKPEIFAEITRRLVEKWPECKPYEGAFDDIVPHLTVADRVDRETLNMVERSLDPQLPIECVAREIWLMTSDQEGLWSKRACWPLSEPPRKATL